MARRKQNSKLSEAEFAEKLILSLRDESRSKGIHSVFSGFNDAWRAYFGTDPVKGVRALEEAGVLVTRFSRRGAMLYLAGEQPVEIPKGKAVLAKVGLA